MKIPGNLPPPPPAQVVDYAMRKKMDVKTAERWLAPMLCYEP